MIKATDLLQEVHFFDLFKVNSRPEEYIMSSCSGKMTTSGRRASEFVIESCSGELTLELPTLIECENLPEKSIFYGQSWFVIVCCTFEYCVVIEF
jgi:hypothetical protein